MVTGRKRKAQRQRDNDREIKTMRDRERYREKQRKRGRERESKRCKERRRERHRGRERQRSRNRVRERQPPRDEMHREGAELIHLLGRRFIISCRTLKRRPRGSGLFLWVKNPGQQQASQD